MRIVRAVSVATFAAFLAVAAGCGDGTKYVKVSGVVKVDGQPYKNAVVAFQPVGDKGNQNPGRGSSAVTDENGRFVLMTDDGQTGAVVGKHRVRIQTKRDEANVFIDPETGSADSAPRSDAKKGGKIDPIPPEWYSDKSTKEFEVPAGGTDQANFDIPSIYAGKKK